MSGAAAGVPRASPSRVDERLIAMYGSVNMAASALATVKMPDVYSEPPPRTEHSLSEDVTDENDWSDENDYYDFTGPSVRWNTESGEMNSVHGSVASITWRQGDQPEADQLASYNSGQLIIMNSASSIMNADSNGAQVVASVPAEQGSVRTRAAPDGKGIDDDLGSCHSDSESKVDAMPAEQRAFVSMEALAMSGQNFANLDGSVEGMEVKPRPRRRKYGKGGKHSLGGRPSRVDEGQAVPIQLTAALLRQHFAMPLHDAARCLGICATAVKKVCRRMGIMQWPFQRLKPIQTRLAKLRLQQRCKSRNSQVLLQVAVEIKQLEQQEEALLQGLCPPAVC